MDSVATESAKESIIRNRQINSIINEVNNEERKNNNKNNKSFEGRDSNGSYITMSSYKYLTFLILTVLLGSLYSITQVSSDITSFRSRLPAHHLTTSPPASYTLPIPSIPYFANKSNILNQLFVKKGWAWTSGIWLIFILVQYFDAPILRIRVPTSNSSTTSNLIVKRVDGSDISRKILTKELYKWSMSSIIWYYLTQATWFITGKGPSVYHRVLLATGAQCYPSSIASATQNADKIITNAVCVGGKGEFWKGGHDVSGHIFLLVHASLFLFGSIKPILHHLPPFSYFYHSPPHNALASPSDSSVSSVEQIPLFQISYLHAFTTYLAVGLLSLWWWMLLMTSIHFHTPLEKFSGLAFAIGAWYCI